MAIVGVTPAVIAKASADTDWTALDAQTDAEIAANVAADPDAAPILTEAETANALVQTVSRRLGLSQAGFAARYHVPVAVLRDWERNLRPPDAPTLAYLRVIACEPDMVARVLGAA